MIATVFRGVINRMISGYLLRDVINKVNGIHFTRQERSTPSAHLYESMLREMRDAAGDSGEFYTPRPVVRSWSRSPTRAGRDRPRPGLRHRRLSGRGVRPSEKQCQTVEDRHTLAGEEHLRRRGQAAALPALAR